MSGDDSEGEKDQTDTIVLEFLEPRAEGKRKDRNAEVDRAPQELDKLPPKANE